MKNRKAIVFFLFWSAVFALVLCLLPNGKQPSAVSVGGRLSFFDAREVVQIDISRKVDKSDVRENVTIARVNGKWRLEAPISAEADGISVKRLIDAIIFAESEHCLSEPDMASLGRSLRDFGLAAPRCKVTLSDGSAQETFSVGRATAAADEVYVRREGYNGVFTVPVKIVEELMCPLVEFRRRRLFNFRPSEVVGFGLKDAGEPLTRLAKSDGQWRIANPMDAPADRQAVEDLIEELCSAQVVDYVMDTGSAHGLGDAEGFAVLLRDTFGAVEKVVFGAADGTNAVWALTSEGAVVHVCADLLQRCRNRQKELEDTRIFPVEASQVASFSISEGFPAYAVSRQSVSAPWMMMSPVAVIADVKVVDEILSRMLSLRGVELVPEGSEGALMVSVGTSTTNFSARCVLGSMLLQDVKLVDILGKTMIRCCRERIKNIIVQTAAGDNWNAKSQDSVIAMLEAGIEAQRVESIVLRNDDFARCGFSHPAYTISFELNDEKSPLRRLLIGSVAPEGGRYAMIGGIDAVFVLPASVISVLTKPVEDSTEGR